MYEDVFIKTLTKGRENVPSKNAPRRRRRKHLEIMNNLKHHNHKCLVGADSM